ncbi:restriction endonuclease [Nocardia cyriacigeorgica]|uniref:Restriction endonuclease n=1 Tax=Nocardia cyriacigeorgica TaxID=135487 RepID=A0A5R8N941_9NOCA|nr:restriction endonuclease [Nocardia cyriacigeorgica]MBF6427482.1 restriction endonuclease [Nocardia cyriacigeorgica]TLF72214.1 restriction endonuclease [Nocardia cyriacigeorgica]
MSIVSTPHDAERLAAQIMKNLGYKGVRLTNGGADGGIDVWSNTGIAQVKLHSKPTGRPDLQRLRGALGPNSAQETLFFTFAGYSRFALEYADQVGMALFCYRIDGTYFAANNNAAKVIQRVRKAEALANKQVRRQKRLAAAEARYQRRQTRSEARAASPEWHLLLAVLYSIAAAAFFVSAVVGPSEPVPLSTRIAGSALAVLFAVGLCVCAVAVPQTSATPRNRGTTSRAVRRFPGRAVGTRDCRQLQ